MLLLHTAVVDDALVLWAERDPMVDAGGEAATSMPTGAAMAGSGADGLAHPRAARHDELAGLLGSLVGVAGPAAAGAQQVHALAWLPSVDDAPLPSSMQRAAPGHHDAVARHGDGAAASAPRLAPWRVPALLLSASLALDVLAASPVRSGPACDGAFTVAPGVAVLAAAARLAAAVVLRHEHVPGIASTARGDDQLHARWVAAPAADLQERLDELARRLPPAVRALELLSAADGAHPHPGPASVTAPRLATVAPVALLQRYVGVLVDALVRRSLQGMQPAECQQATTPHDRWLEALASDDGRLRLPTLQAQRLAEQVHAWQRPLRHPAAASFRLCLRLEEPVDDDDDGEAGAAGGPTWYLRYLLQARDEPSVLVPVASAWDPAGSTESLLKARGFAPGEHVLAPLAEAARIVEAVEESLREPRPAGCELDTAAAYAFLTEAAPRLERAGVGVLLPSWRRSSGRAAQLSLRAAAHTDLTGGRQALASLNLRTLVSYDWRVAIGNEELTGPELRALADQKLPLVRVRGRWMELDPRELDAALAMIARIDRRSRAARRTAADGEDVEEGSLSATIGEVVRMAAGSGVVDGVPVSGVSAGGELAELLRQLARAEAPHELPPPRGLRAQLRPYQLRGYAWLACMAQLGLGACLADDMGLGKSVQALALVQQLWEQPPDGCERGPTLIVCPTSVLGNWQRESERFTPDLPLFVHHGGSRLRGDELRDACATHAIVVTSYSLLARDADELADVPWQVVVLDEAQNIKNPGTRQARAARALDAHARVALTGTPVENSVGDLWSLMEFLNPGLLGAQADFRRRYMLPIQTGSLEHVGERLRRIVAPFVLRREKRDRSVIADLPEKLESTVRCTLTAEQVTLYEAIVRETEAMITGKHPMGVERRGIILASLSKLKQVCNHPAQLLADGSQLHGRSGKLERLTEMLEEVLENRERALVFTQFAGMAKLVHQHLGEVFDEEVLLLTGATPRAHRDAIVARFQEPGRAAPPVLVVSLKAGGSGLNLTAATHVFHFDRWWNPAVEQQATDRAFRIGQSRDVQVHAFVCAGTVEERIADMLAHKQRVATSVIGSGEQWLTDLGDDEVLELMSLRDDTLLQAGRLDDIHTPIRGKRNG